MEAGRETKPGLRESACVCVCASRHNIRTIINDRCTGTSFFSSTLRSFTPSTSFWAFFLGLFGCGPMVPNKIRAPHRFRCWSQKRRLSAHTRIRTERLGRRNLYAARFISHERCYLTNGTVYRNSIFILYADGMGFPFFFYFICCSNSNRLTTCEARWGKESCTM